MKTISSLICFIALIGSIYTNNVSAQPPDGGPPDGGPPDGGPPNGGAGGGSGGAPAAAAGTPSFPTSTGNSPSTECPKTSGSCSTTGADAYAKWDMTYDSSTGIFTGSLITTICPPNTVNTSPSPSVSCTKQTYPDPTFTKTPIMMPYLGAVGFSLKGVMVSSSYENGFTDGQACSGGTCDGGMDLGTCEAKLLQTCVNHTITHPEVLLDDCSGHASPYHIHKDLVCDYNEYGTTTHSDLVAVLLDGRGLYGMYEDSNGKPTDLDECGGHYGPVPSAKLDNDTSTGSATYVYHYHTRDEFPYTIGCFGPVSNKTTTCEDLYVDECGPNANTTTEYQIMVSGVSKTIYYKKWCPCVSSNPAALVATGGTNVGTPKTSSPTSSTPSPTTTNPTTPTTPTTAKPTTNSPATKSPSPRDDRPSNSNSLLYQRLSYKTMVGVAFMVLSTIALLY